MAPAPETPGARAPRLPGWAVAALAGVLLVLLWRATWFLCDDAYIAFRYAANARAGLGYVWNPPPFRPVEGYTSLLWVALLRGVWALVGVEPPRAANLLALLSSAAALTVVYRLASRIVERRAVAGAPGLRPWAPPLAGLAVLGVLADRTFLFSASSGLETALFNALALGWLAAALAAPTARGRAPLLASLAALIALCRPDGLLYAAATPLVLLPAARLTAPARWRALSPLAAVPAHLLWRHATYGEWLPNTYYAKVVRPWPEAGARYLASFALEHALVVPALMLLGGWVALRRRERRGAAGRGSLARGAALAVPVSAAAYYTFVAGGDYFEYRPYLTLACLVPLGVLWAALALFPRRPGRAGALVLAALVAGNALPWAHFRVQSRDYVLYERELTPVAPEVPALLRGYVSRFDRLQEWLIERKICRRYHMHKAFLVDLQGRTPPREEWLRRHPYDAADIPVAAGNAVGYLGWVLSGTAAVVDLMGLNDAVVARNPVAAPNEGRVLAHDRSPPPGYVECFRPNVSADTGEVFPRRPPLGADAVRACEAAFRAGGRASGLAPPAEGAAGRG